MNRPPNAPPTHAGEEPHDESELIGLSEINFLLVIALLVTVSATVAQTAAEIDTNRLHGSETVRLDHSPVLDAAPAPSDQARESGGFLPTHRLVAEGDAPDGPIVIAVPPGFPLDDIRLLIERAP